VAANIKWPPQTIGARILDREGHEVFARQKAQREIPSSWGRLRSPERRSGRPPCAR
jgi:hypothetical protein